MTKLETDQRLLDAMKAAAAHHISPEESRQQRVSFIMGSLSEHNDMTREQVRDAIQQKEGRLAQNDHP